ncbi:MAG: DUF2490 domain-containing protein, partial [Cyclobacteriaceae bacterium]|nr:DUF2490 domain-containing protein [Cyclobacteriaceae bacterium]
MIKAFRFLSLSFMLVGSSLFAQETGEDKLGAWWMYFGTTKVSNKLSIHSELQLRMYEPVSTFNQLLPRVGLNYHISSNAMATAGYAYIPTESYEKGSALSSSKESRIWEQFILRNTVGKFSFEHRYRLEQRWISSSGSTRYRDRARYRLMITVPLSKPAMEDKTIFLAVYDELFMNIDNSPFDQNRLYGALGYRLNKNLSFQGGYLRHRLGALSYDRLQFGVFLS